MNTFLSLNNPLLVENFIQNMMFYRWFCFS